MMPHYELRITASIPLPTDAMERAKDVASYESAVDSLHDVASVAGGKVAVEVVRVKAKPVKMAVPVEPVVKEVVIAQGGSPSPQQGEAA